MSGREGPSDAEMAKRLEKRLDEMSKFDKRYNRNGTGVIKASGSGTPQPQRASDSAPGDEKTPDPKNGFPQVDLDAANSGGLTKGNKPTAANTLAFNVMYARLSSCCFGSS